MVSPMTARYHLAQVNVARPRAPLDSPTLAGFMAELDPVNALADAAPGFVWRLQTEDGNATAIRVLGDENLMINLSVWESLEALGAFVHDSRHRDVLRRRREWFVRLAEAYLALWWVPAGHQPTVREAEARLLHLRAHGPTAVAFTMRTPFPPPDGDAPAADWPTDRWTCPTA
jgi:heme-degrading monooxygenase HmoA